MKIFTSYYVVGNAIQAPLHISPLKNSGLKKHFCFLMLFIVSLSFSTAMLAQTAPAIEWQKSFGGSYSDEAYSVQQTSDGGYIVAGYANSEGGDVHGNHGGFDSWIVKLNAQGDTLWTKSLGGSGTDKAYSVKQTFDGGYIIAGSSDSNDGDVSGNHGANDCWIVKINSTGNIIWSKSLGGSASDIAASIQQTSDTGYIVAAYTYSNNGDVSGWHGNPDYWVVKLDASGNIVWSNALGGIIDEYAQSIQQTLDGGYIVAGYTGSNDGDVSGNHGQFDYWVIKLDASGDTLWTKTLGGSQAEIGRSILQTADGGYLVSGASQSNNGDVSGNHGAYDAWIVKLDNSGNITWQNSLGGSGDEDAYATYQTADGGFIIAGHSNSNNGDVSGNHGDRDYWIVKLDASGEIVWSKSLGGSYFDLAISIQLTADCGYIIAGYSASSNFDVTDANGGTDFWIVKLAADANEVNTYFADADGDGFGSAAVTQTACSQMSGYVTDSTDCNDADSSVHTLQLFYVDGDGDGYGSMVTAMLCSATAPAGYSANNADCNDTKPLIYALITSYADADGDGYGDPSSSQQFCKLSPPPGYASDNTDCIDLDNEINPATIWFQEADGDGFSTGNSFTGCISPAGYVLPAFVFYIGNDCNDNNADVNPDATEVCNGYDDDCDSEVDFEDQSFDFSSLNTYYYDGDGDGYGASNPVAFGCEAPVAYVSQAGDCNNNNAAIYPNAPEICDGLDNDCDGSIDSADPNVVGQQTWFADADGDGFGNPSDFIVTCSAPGRVTNSNDCDDTNAAKHTGATDFCDNIDNDCDGLTDEDATFIIYYADADGDGYGNPSVTQTTCTGNVPAGYVSNSNDCDDNNAIKYAGATDVCDNIDNDCDGLTDEDAVFINYYADADGDGYGDPNVSQSLCTGITPNGYVTNTNDCDDTNPAKHSGAADVCDGIDNDCDGSTDEDAAFITYYADSDGDGFGNIAVSQSKCNGVPVGYVINNTDCNDGNSTAYPGAIELCDAVDNDCDGQIDEGIVSATISYSGSAAICNGSSIILNANTGIAYTYQWKRNGANITGATNAVHTVTTAGNYSVVITVPGGCLAVSAATSVSILPSPAATIATPDGLDLCGKTKVRLQANNGSGFTYQWYKDGLTVSGATFRTYQAKTTGSYYVIVTHPNGCNKTSAGKTVVKTCKEDNLEFTADNTVKPEMLLYPNPTSGNINIGLELSDVSDHSATIIVYSAVGQVVYSSDAFITEGILNESIVFDKSVASGVYVVTVVVNDQKFIQRLIISR